MSFLRNVYEMTAWIGIMENTVVIYLTMVIGLIILFLSLYLLSIDDSQMIDAEAKIINIVNGKDKHMLDIEYIVDAKIYKKQLDQIPDEYYFTKDTIEITYDANNPNNVTYRIPKLKVITLLMSIGFLISAAVVYMKYYLVNNYKIIASLEGVSFMASLFTYL
jgi:hypothetical protein